jgi:hypothetical protein
MVSVRTVPHAAAETGQEEPLLFHDPPVQVPTVQGELCRGLAFPSGTGGRKVVVTRNVKERNVQRRNHVLEIIGREISAPQDQLDISEPILDPRAIDQLHHLIAQR